MQPYSTLPLASRVTPWKSALFVFLPSLIAFILLDVLWISAANNLYQTNLKPILKPTGADPVAALLSWLCIVAVNQLFVLPGTIGAASALTCLGQVGAAVACVSPAVMPLSHTPLACPRTIFF